MTTTRAAEEADPTPTVVDSAVTAFVADIGGRSLDAAQLWGRQFDAGLAWVDFPLGLGGLDAPRSMRAAVSRRLAAAGVPDSADTNGIGVSLAAPVLLSHGTRQQQERYLRPLFTGAEIWCQLFSEPGAGSDLASLSTRAALHGDSYVVDGQKVWTTLGHMAHWGLLCARTDPDAPKHAGLSMFIIDMHADGVDCRPIRQITGDAHFNEVFFREAVVPAANLIGAEGDGWSSIIATLANERATFAATPLARGEGAIALAVASWAKDGHRRGEMRDRFLRLWVRAEAVRLSELAAMESEGLGTPSPAWSYLKVMRSELDQDVLSFCVSMLGADGLHYPSYEMRQPTTMKEGLDEGGDLRYAFLFSRSATIAGGTSEVQRTIVADRVLGLPREPGVDRGTPWRELRRS